MVVLFGIFQEKTREIMFGAHRFNDNNKVFPHKFDVYLYFLKIRAFDAKKNSININIIQRWNNRSSCVPVSLRPKHEQNKRKIYSKSIH